MSYLVWRRLALIGYFGLLLTLLSWILLAPHGEHYPTSAMLLFGVMPLLLPMRGILYGRRYTHAWAAYLVLLYFAHGIGEWYAATGSAVWYPLLETVFSSLFFVSAMFYIRSHARHVKD